MNSYYFLFHRLRRTHSEHPDHLAEGRPPHPFRADPRPLPGHGERRAEERGLHRHQQRAGRGRRRLPVLRQGRPRQRGPGLRRAQDGW